MLTISDGLIEHNDGYMDSGDVARQLGFLPPAGSPTEARLTRIANARTQLTSKVHGAEPERIADGVWVLRGGFPSKIDERLPDRGRRPGHRLRRRIEAMGRRAESGLRPLRRRQARGPRPRRCRPSRRRTGARRTGLLPPGRARRGRVGQPGSRLLGSDQARAACAARPTASCFRRGTAVRCDVAGTVAEGDEVAGFRVVDLPGHAPGLIGLFRDSDRLALVSDCFYTLDPQTGRKGAAADPAPRVRPRRRADACFDPQARRPDPASAWAGHADPVTGDVATQLRQAAAK